MALLQPLALCPRGHSDPPPLLSLKLDTVARIGSPLSLTLGSVRGMCTGQGWAGCPLLCGKKGWESEGLPLLCF